jgi:3D (Asp-Asp-Asp) domain-containing protein
VLNIDGFVRGEIRWKRVKSRYGIDSRGCALVPFRSAAVDPRVIPLGTRLFIRDTKGIKLPGGGTHDGIWYATDIGPLIKGRRIDLFVGRGIQRIAVIESAGIDYLDTVHAEILDQNLGCP